MEDHSTSVMLLAAAIIIAYLAHFGLATSTVTKFHFVTVGPPTNIQQCNKEDTETCPNNNNYNNYYNNYNNYYYNNYYNNNKYDNKYNPEVPLGTEATIEDLQRPFYDSNYTTTSKSPSRTLKYTRNYITFPHPTSNISGVMYCPVRPGGPPPTIVLADYIRRQRKDGRLTKTVEQYLLADLCVLPMIVLPPPPTPSVITSILSYLETNVGPSLKVGIRANGWIANEAVGHLSVVERLGSRSSNLLKAVIADNPIFSVGEMARRLMEDTGVRGVDLLRAVVVDIFRPGVKFYVNLSLKGEDGVTVVERYSYRAREALRLALGYVNNAETLRDKDDGSAIRLEIGEDGEGWDVYNQKEEYGKVRRMFSEERGRREFVSFKDSPGDDVDPALDALLFFSNQMSKDVGKRAAKGKDRFMPDGSLRISEKDERILSRMHSMARKREGGRETIIGGFTNKMFGKLLGF